MRHRGIFTFQPYGGGRYRLLRYYGPGAFDVVKTSLSWADAERLCARANRLLAVLRGTLARYAREG